MNKYIKTRGYTSEYDRRELTPEEIQFTETFFSKVRADLAIADAEKIEAQRGRDLFNPIKLGKRIKTGLETKIEQMRDNLGKSLRYVDVGAIKEKLVIGGFLTFSAFHIYAGAKYMEMVDDYVTHPETKVVRNISASYSTNSRTDWIGNDGQVYLTLNYDTGKSLTHDYRTENDAIQEAASYNRGICNNAGVVLSNPVLGNINLYTPEKCGFPKSLPIADIDNDFYGKYANYLSEKKKQKIN